jgi:hypothetical protein
MSLYKINHYLDKMNKMLVTTKTTIMAVVLLLMAIAIANPVIALAVNQSAYPPNYDPDIDYTDKECAEMFPNYTEGYYDCTGGIGTPNPGP